MTEAEAQAVADPHSETLALVGRVLGGSEPRTARFRDNLRVYLEPATLVAVATALKSEAGFDLVELGCTDYMGYPDRDAGLPRFEVHYAFLNRDTHERVILKVGVSENALTLPTLTGLWMGANWMEREVFDMYGIAFEGHPDLRRILLPNEFTAHPLRKDYPLRGRGERHNFPRLTREES